MEVTFERPSKRACDQIRSVRIVKDFTCHAEGSVLIEMGNTKVICTASVEEKLPPWMKDANSGWVTAEYGMLPRATGTRTEREAVRGVQSGRTQEIQRLIGRSLRAIIDLSKLGPRTIKLDCDVIQADGGTRCASISGAYVALQLAVNRLLEQGVIKENPIKAQVAAISVGIYKGVPVCDVDYEEDHQCDTDMNIVMTSNGRFVEMQGTAEGEPFTEEEMTELIKLAKGGLKQIFLCQQEVLK